MIGLLHKPLSASAPVLDLSRARLRRALADLTEAAHPGGGLSRHMTALWLKSALFTEVFGAGAAPVSEVEFLNLAAFMAPVRRRIAPMIARVGMAELRARLDILLQGQGPVDARMARFLACFSEERDNRWLRDLAAEVLHFTQPDTVPLMTRWIWDAGASTGALREIWQAEDIDRAEIDLTDDLTTFTALQSQIEAFLTAEGHERDRVWLCDLLLAHVYAGYIDACGGRYLRGDDAEAADPMRHTRRILGLDAVDAESGRIRLMLLEGPPDLLPAEGYEADA